MKFAIYHTNDLHCNYEALKKTYLYLKQYRGENDLYFDSGDLCDLSDIIVQGDMGRSLFSLFSCLRCDGMTLGNGEIDLGRDNIENISDYVPLICTNTTRNNGSAINGVFDCRIIEVQGVRFLLLGVSPYYKSDLTPNHYNVFSMMNDLMVSEPIEALRKKLAEYQGQYDHSILISHSGVSVDKAILKETGIDICLGGHSHEVYNEPFYTQSGKGLYLGHLTIEIDNGCLKELGNEQIDLDKCVFDSDESKLFEDKIDKLREKAISILGKELLCFDELKHDDFAESELGNFICDLLMKEYHPDLAIMHNGIANGSLVRPVSRMSLVQTFPSKLNPTLFPIKGSSILEAIRLSFNEEHIHGTGKGPGFRGKVLGTLSYSANVKVTLSPFSVSIDGELVDEEKTYLVCADDYLQRGSGYPMLKARDEVAQFKGGFIRDHVKNHLLDEDLYISARQRRIFK